MTTVLFAAALRMPHTASVAAPTPLALGVSAEPRPANRPCGEIGGIIAPAFGGRRGGTESSDRFGGSMQPGVDGWYWHDQAQLAGGGPLRG